MKLYIAIIEEVILDSEGKPTLELRIRVPNMHYGLKKEFLPIAKPLILPGVIINPEEFINQIERTTRVYVFFEQNNLNRPRYISTTDLPEFLVISTDIEEDGDNTNKLTSPKAVKEYVDAEISNIDGSAGVSFVEPITFFKEEFSGGVDYIENYLSHIGDTLLTNGGIIYTKVGDRVWDVVTPPLKDNRVVFIQKGKDHGGNMYVFKDYKFVLVKNSEQAKWEIKER